MDFSMIGPALALGLGCIGSAIGCGIGGMAFQAVISRVEENHGKFMGMAAMAASQSIYGFILMLFMKDRLEQNLLSPMAGIAIGAAAGAALMISSIYQGMCAASGIQAASKQPAIIGKSFVILGIIESFSLFALIFSFKLMQS